MNTNSVHSVAVLSQFACTYMHMVGLLLGMSMIAFHLVLTAHNLISPALADLQWQHPRPVTYGSEFPAELQPCPDFDIFFLLHSLRTPFTFQCDHSYSELRGVNDVVILREKGITSFFYFRTLVLSSM